MRECQHGLAVLKLRGLQDRPQVFDLFAVHLGQRHQPHPLARVPLVDGMDIIVIVIIAGVEGHAIVAVLDLGGGHGLRLAQLGKRAIALFAGGAAEVGDLHEQEREIALVPLLSPLLDDDRHDLAVLEGTVGIALPLIPEHTLDAIGDNLRDDAVPAVSRRVAHGVGNLLRRIFEFGRLGPACLFSGLGVHLPLGHLLLVLPVDSCFLRQRLGADVLGPIEHRRKVRVVAERLCRRPGLPG